MYLIVGLCGLHDARLRRIGLQMSMPALQPSARPCRSFAARSIFTLFRARIYGRIAEVDGQDHDLIDRLEGMAARLLEFEQYIVERAELLEGVIAKWSPLVDDEDAFWNAVLAD